MYIGNNEIYEGYIHCYLRPESSRAILKWGVYVAYVIQRSTHNLLAEKAI